MTRRQYYKYLLQVATRPAMYEINNVEELNIFVNGYSIGAQQDFARLEEFDAFVNKKHGFSGEHFRWNRLVRLRSGGDFHSLELFRFWFEEFLEEIG